MKHLKSFNKLFEEAVPKPVKKFPTEPAIHWNYLIKILEESGINPHESLVKGKNMTYFQDFCFEKCSRNNVVYPNMKDIEGWSKEGQNDARYGNFIFGESVFLLPEHYDSSSDIEQSIKKRNDFLNTMREYARDMIKGKKEQEIFIKNAEKHTEFPPDSYEWINPALKVIHDKLGQYYKDGKLRVWFPKDREYDGWEGYDYPHKYNIVGHLDRPNGVYYLSDIEKFIDDKYGIKDPLLYEFVIKNQYIEGRHWERVWSFPTEYTHSGKGSKNKLQKSNFGKYGMEPTENITNILNILEHEFGDEISGTDYEGFPVYIDYYKEIKIRY